MTKARPVCVADTSALLNMRDILIDHRSLLDWLGKEFRVRLSDEAYNELSAYRSLYGADANIVLARVRSWKRPTPQMDRYAKCLFPAYSFPAGAGERHNCCLSFCIVAEGREARHLIFLSDDGAACDATSRVFRDFPLGVVWTTFDFILFLFLRRRTEIAGSANQFRGALEMLRQNIVADLQPPPTRRGKVAAKNMLRLQQLSTLWMDKEEEYRNRLNIANKILGCL